MDRLFFPFLGIFTSFFPILVIVGIIWLIVVLVRRRRGGEEPLDPGIGTLKRVYYYGLSFVALMVTASGIVLLVDFAADGLLGPQVLSGGETKLALGLALTLVGTPIWFIHWKPLLSGLGPYRCRLLLGLGTPVHRPGRLHEPPGPIQPLQREMLSVRVLIDVKGSGYAELSDPHLYLNPSVDGLGALQGYPEVFGSPSNPPVYAAG